LWHISFAEKAPNQLFSSDNYYILLLPP